MAIYFYTTKGQYGEFSNFSNFGIKVGGLWWPTTEHYFQAQKFENEQYQEAIRLARTPKRAAELGRSRKLPMRDDWSEFRDDVMKLAVLKKFKTHKKLGDLLQGTEGERLVENAPGDYYWGCGADGSGENKLGQILEEVRSELKDKT
ncbi:MAG: NADAR family protein [Methylococcales bacterium]|nr:NADAR family protein [Methylococcales bacterium]